jgi:fluoride exporter
VSGLGFVTFLVAAGVAAPSRYLVDLWVQEHTQANRPWGTAAVNLSGCFLAGLLAGWGLYHGAGSTTVTVLGVGGLGSYSTFSTLTFETVRLAEEGALAAAALNCLGSLVGGGVAAVAGIALVGLL